MPSLMIKNFAPLGSPLMERGKIKIGRKGKVRTSQHGHEFQPPEKLDHFIITTMQRGPDGNFLRDDALHAELAKQGFADADGCLRRIPVRLVFDEPELNFQTRYVCYRGRTMWCTGDGEQASQLANPETGERKTVACPCFRVQPTFQGDDGRGNGKCRPNGVLSVVIDGAKSVGGVWKFRTTSYNTILAILGSTMHIQREAGGPLAGIPLHLVIQPKAATNPINGQAVTVYVVGLEFAGDHDNLRNIGYETARKRLEYKLQIEQLEQRARVLLAAPSDVGVGTDDIDDVLDEYYPEAAAAAAAVSIAAPQSETPPPAVPPQPTVMAEHLPGRRIAAGGLLQGAPPASAVAAGPASEPRKRGRPRKQPEATYGGDGEPRPRAEAAAAPAEQAVPTITPPVAAPMAQPQPAATPTVQPPHPATQQAPDEWAI